MVDITRPPPIQQFQMLELMRWQQHTTDNIARVNKRLLGYSFTLVHGVELIVPRPDTLDYTVTKAAAVASTGLPVTSVVVRDLGTTLGITAYYAPPFGAIAVSRTTDTSIADNPSPYAGLQWQQADFTEGTNISWSSGANTRLTFAAPGRVEVSWYCLFNTAAGGFRDGYVGINGAGEWNARSLIPGGSFAAVGGSDEITVAANDYIETLVYQNSGGPLGIIASGTNKIAMRARYAGPPASYSAAVTLLLLD